METYEPTYDNKRPHTRAAGLLLHPTSLPSPHGVGDLGEGAYRFIDWLHEASMTRWQVLPLVPAGPGNSPYATLSALAGNPMLIDLVGLHHDGLLPQSALAAPAFSLDRVDFERVTAFKDERLDLAAKNLWAGHNPSLKNELEQFASDPKNLWAHETAAFLALREARNKAAWWDWEEGLRRREPSALAAATAAVKPQIEIHLARFFFFERQWQKLRAYAHGKGIQIIGDVPIYVDRDSVDVWMNQDQFRLDEHGQPEAVAGVPPDFFSELGQLWGNPLYRWDAMAKDGHAWWVRRIRRALEQVDVVRLDHFRGFSAFWEVPADAKDARSGRWVRGPGRPLFDDLRAALGSLPLIAEDLGIIDDDVENLRDGLELPGMRILQFAFGATAEHPFLPHNHVRRAVVYTATHDNDTTLGWWQTSGELIRDHVRRYLAVPGNDVVWDLIRAAFESVADLCIVPLQDVLCLDSGSRMNVPGLAEGNWGWRVRVQAFNTPLASRLRQLATIYGRARQPERPGAA
jgi:4-alpha-glucanotransferase